MLQDLEKYAPENLALIQFFLIQLDTEADSARNPDIRVKV